MLEASLPSLLLPFLYYTRYIESGHCGGASHTISSRASLIFPFFFFIHSFFPNTWALIFQGPALFHPLTVFSQLRISPSSYQHVDDTLPSLGCSLRGSQGQLQSPNHVAPRVKLYLPRGFRSSWAPYLVARAGKQQVLDRRFLIP